MGCIVNGPGEMADADFGYVGEGRGKISLYKAGEVVKRGILERDENDDLAVETLQKIYDETWGEGKFKVVGVKTTEQVVFGGGNIHCITQQEPAASAK